MLITALLGMFAFLNLYLLISAYFHICNNHEHGFWKVIFGDISPQKHYILTQVSVQMITSVSLLWIIMLLVWDDIAFLSWF